jgi:hypothetical protein
MDFAWQRLTLRPLPGSTQIILSMDCTHSLACTHIQCVPFAEGCHREALRRQDGMRRPASLAMQTDAREAPETRPPPLRADARSSQAL